MEEVIKRIAKKYGIHKIVVEEIVKSPEKLNSVKKKVKSKRRK